MNQQRQYAKHIVLACFFMGMPRVLWGKVIAFSGMGGSGKSTMARLLAKELNVSCISEPEEDSWSPIIKNYKNYGESSAILAFRMMWLQMSVDADILSREDKLVFLDSLFLKIGHTYLGKPGTEWLIPPQDPYLSVLIQLSKIDEKYFPHPDYVVLLDVCFEDWVKFLNIRDRDWDNLQGVRESFVQMKGYIEGATIEYCKKYSIPFLIFSQQFGDPAVVAQQLKELLIKSNILTPLSPAE